MNGGGRGTRKLSGDKALPAAAAGPYVVGFGCFTWGVYPRRAEAGHPVVDFRGTPRSYGFGGHGFSLVALATGPSRTANIQFVDRPDLTATGRHNAAPLGGRTSRLPIPEFPAGQAPAPSGNRPRNKTRESLVEKHASARLVIKPGGVLEGLFPPNHATTPVFRGFFGREQLQICGYAAVANGKKENRKRLLFCWRDKAMNKAVKEFVRCGCGFHPGRATRPEDSRAEWSLRRQAVRGAPP